MAQILRDNETCKEKQILCEKLNGEVCGSQMENYDDEDHVKELGKRKPYNKKGISLFLTEHIW